MTGSLTDLFDRHEVTDGLDHAADLGPVLLDDDVTDALEAERAQRLALVGLAPDGRLLLLDLELCHYWVTPAAAGWFPSSLCLSRAAAATCSTVRPRRAATCSGCSSILRAATVACTMLIWLEEPSDLLRTSWTPAQSSTARTGPPAITQVPSA